MILMSESFLRNTEGSYWLITVLAVGLIQLAMPYAPILADIVIASMFLLDILFIGTFRLRKIAYLIGLAGVQLPLLIYNLAVFSGDPLWNNFVQQNQTLSPHPIYYIFGYGLIWPFVLIGSFELLKSLLRRRNNLSENIFRKLSFLVGVSSWFILALFMAYLPWGLQRRFTLAFSIPIGFLATYGLENVIRFIAHTGLHKWVRKRAKLIPVFILGIASISPIVFTLGNLLFITKLPDKQFDPIGLIAAADWLKMNGNENDVVLSAELNAQYLAANTGMRVYVGHPIETLDYPRKYEELKSFLTGGTPWAKVCEMGIDWVIYSDREAQLGTTIPQAKCLIQAFSKDGVSLYKISQRKYSR
jgi:hypothetical protein